MPHQFSPHNSLVAIWTPCTEIYTNADLAVWNNA